MHITHDFHIHTDLSLCAGPTATLENYLAAADRLGLTKLGFANHFWDAAVPGANDFYVPQNFEHVAELLPALRAASRPERKLFFGCECEYDPAGHGVACTEAAAERFDFMIVPNSHTHMMMPPALYHPYEKHAEFMLTAYEEILTCPVSRYVTAMAHPFEAVCCPYDNGILIDLIPDDRYRRLFDLTAEKGVAVEINLSAMHEKTPEEIARLPQLRLFRLARACGCRFLFGSDAHDDRKHDSFGNADLVAGLLDLTEDDLAPIAR